MAEWPEPERLNAMSDADLRISYCEAIAISFMQSAQKS